MTQDYYLNIGNPNVYDLVSNINSRCSVYLTCSYDVIKNKWYLLENMAKQLIILICI